MKIKTMLKIPLRMRAVLPRYLDGKHVTPLLLQHSLNGHTSFLLPMKFCLHTNISKVFSLMTSWNLLLTSQTCTASNAILPSHSTLLFRNLDSSSALCSICHCLVFQPPACFGATVATFHMLLMWCLLHAGKPSKDFSTSTTTIVSPRETWLTMMSCTRSGLFWITSSPSWNNFQRARRWVWMNKWCHLRARAESSSTYPVNQESEVTKYWSLLDQMAFLTTLKFVLGKYCPSTWASRRRGKWQCGTAPGRANAKE